MEMCKGVDRVVLGCLFVATGMGAAQADANMEEEFRLIKKAPGAARGTGRVSKMH